MITTTATSFTSPETTLPGWEGTVDLHSATDLLAHEDQIVDLNQAGRGHLQTTLVTPANRACLVRFRHGLNQHCVSSASFDVVVDGTVVGSFTSSAAATALERSTASFRTGATGTTILRFQSTTDGCGAATIDDVLVGCPR